MNIDNDGYYQEVDEARDEPFTASRSGKTWRKDWVEKRQQQAEQMPEYRRALDLSSGYGESVGTGKHGPDRKQYSRGGRSEMKWGCWGCDYWTGYHSKTKASRMILAHADAKNGETDE